uniref:NADH-ubiquinone oxidoreductase chain 2 n=1 Tax=Megalodontes quinquecinctus TaxID=2491145 RepID=A0A3Q8U9W1_9HYME|nr:NADH dehydrogenase subunit 2 [Megalodontes quinquecinctus]
MKIHTSNFWLFFNLLIFSTLMCISSNSWFFMWMMLEMNLISFIALMNNKSPNIYLSESMIIYFLNQVLASIILLFSLISLNFLYESSLFNFLIMSFFNISMLMKMGSIPFHFWILNLINKMMWMDIFLILSWQKLAPMIMLSYYMMYPLLEISILLSLIFSILFMMNIHCLKKIMTFSSINNLGWMMMCLKMENLIWTIYFMIYMILLFNLSTMFYIYNFNSINQIFNNFYNNSLIFYSINFLSLSGLPPFLGFLPKWLTIKMMILNKFILFSIIMMISSLFMLKIYIQMFLPSIIMCKKIKWVKFNYYYPFSSMLTFMTFISIFTLIIFM